MATVVSNYLTVDGEILAETRGGVDRDYLPDPLGSTAALLDSARAKTDTFAYWPYGEERSRSGISPTPFRYVGTLGYHADQMNVGSYVRARHYRPGLARWQTVDPLWPDEMAYGYVGDDPTDSVDPKGLQQSRKRRAGPKHRPPTLPPWSVHRHFEDRLGDCGLSSDDAHALALVFLCIAGAESSFNHRTTAQGINETAYGLFQIGSAQWSGFGCAPAGCAGKMTDPMCNMEAALNLFVSMCNDNPGFNPQNAFRGYWGCTRSEGKTFYPCLSAAGLTMSGIRKLPCPKRSPKCPGCKSRLGGVKLR